MRKFTSKQLRELWIKFYTEKGHSNIGSASVLPENDPSVLFTTAGMHPLVPYLMGEPHPMGKRLCNVQKCIRTGDIDSVGDRSHLTFFEMMGNWSLGDYFKKEKIQWSYEFITSEKYLGLKKEEFAVTVFGGNNDIPRDEETAKLWEEAGVPKDRIYFLPMSENFWSLDRGPCGPCSESFLDTGKPKCSPECNPSCNCGKFMEIGNDVYMQYNRIGDTEYIKNKQNNVDTGFGLERNMVVLNGVKSVYATEVFASTLNKLEELSGKQYKDYPEDEFTKSFRVIADHLRAATAVLGDDKGITPSNTDAGYVLRRLIRKSIRHCRILGIAPGQLSTIAQTYIEYFKEVYPEFNKNKDKIIAELNAEEERFLKTIASGTKEFEKVIEGILRHEAFSKQTVAHVISGKAAFRLYDTFGFPIELTVEMAAEKGFTVDEAGFKEAYAAHQELARTASAGHFKGGLADSSEQTVKLHTACHLLNAALRKVLGDHVFQKGSNITAERLRFDFSHGKPVTKEELQQVEDFVNQAIQKSIPVEWQELTVEEAKAAGAIGVFDNKYGNKVKVYSIEGVSKEICGGPHAGNTADLKRFKIAKEESSSAGVRRIKAVLE